VLALLQFDATSIALIEKMLEEGRLPALAELRQRGSWHRLGRSTPLFVEAGSYVSLYSGSEVGDHGIYSAFQWSANEQRVRFMDAFPPPTAVWDRLSRAGLRSLVIDPYESWPPGETSGLRLLNGWQFKHKLLLRISKPPGAKAALSLRLGRPPPVEQHYGRQSADRLLALRPRLLAAPGRAADAVGHLLSRERFDLVWVTFSAAHFAGHYYWDLSRTTDGRLDGIARRELEGTMADAYAAVDAAIGRVVAALPEDADVIVLSPIGMAPEASRSDLLPDMLRAVLEGPPSSPPGERPAENGAGGGSAIWRLRASLPGRWRGAIARPLPGMAVRELTARLQLRGTDWSRMRAFALPGDHSGYIRLNLRGREREGVVDPSDADALADEISAGLATFRDPDGAPSAEHVHRVAKEIDGDRVGQLPDLVVRWSDRPSAGLPGLSSPEFGDVVRRGVGSGRSGNHTVEAWALVVPGSSRRRDLGREPRLGDVAATAYALSGADASGLSGDSLLDPA
jgi:predicted AlkP superfamily phosphohydrolase/phosphomutase